MLKHVYRSYFSVIFLIFIVLSEASAFDATTISGRILKTDGSAISGAVSFSLEVYDPTETCVIYREQINGVNMSSTGDFEVALGKGAKAYPTGAFTLGQVFANSAALTCEGASTYTPAASDTRKLRLKFYDGVSWKTFSPSITLNAIPYSFYAESAAKLGTNVASDFLLKNILPTCAAGEFLTWSGTAFTCLTASGGGGGTGTVTSVTSANAYLSVATGTTTPVITANVGTTANTLAAGNDARFTDSRAPSGSAGGDLLGSYPNPTLATSAVTTAKLADSSVTSAKIVDGTIAATDFAAGSASGQVFVFNGSAWTAARLNYASLTNSLAANPFPAANCSANQFLTWSSASDSFACTSLNIGTGANQLVQTDSSGLISTSVIPSSVVTQWTTQGSAIHFDGTRVGIGTGSSTTQAKLEVVGQVRTIATAGGGTASNSSTTVSWASGNTQATTYNCQNPIVLSDLLDGATYILAVKDTTAAYTCSFTSAGDSIVYSPPNGPRTLGTQSVYTMVKVGSTVYVSWITGFQ